VKQKVKCLLVALVLPLLANACLQGMKHLIPAKLFDEGVKENQVETVKKAIAKMNPNISRPYPPGGPNAIYLPILSIVLNKMTRYPAFKAAAEALISNPAMRLKTLTNGRTYILELPVELTDAARAAVSLIIRRIEKRIQELLPEKMLSEKESRELLAPAFRENNIDAILEALAKQADPNLGQDFSPSPQEPPVGLSFLEIAITKMMRHPAYARVIDAFIKSPFMRFSILRDALTYAVKLYVQTEEKQPVQVSTALPTAINKLSKALGYQGRVAALQKAVDLNIQQPSERVPVAMSFAFMVARALKSSSYLDLVAALARNPDLPLQSALALLLKYRYLVSRIDMREETEAKKLIQSLGQKKGQDKILEEKLGWAREFITSSLETALELAIDNYAKHGTTPEGLADQGMLNSLLNNKDMTGYLIVGALRYAIQQGYITPAFFILKIKRGIIQEYINEVARATGMTALAYAVDKGYTDLVKELLDLGADPNILNHNNRTALDLIMQPKEELSGKRDVEAIAALLKSHGGKTALELGIT
jgi:hypothetical protein